MSVNSKEAVVQALMASGLPGTKERAGAERVFAVVADTIKAELTAKRGFGVANAFSLEIVERAAREGRNPKTGEKLAIGAKLSYTLSLSKPIKDALNAPKSAK